MVKYIVQPGDTLGTIAGKYGTSVRAIVQANGIRNPDMIHSGQILRVPTHHYDDNNHYGYKHHDDNNNNYHNNSHYHDNNNDNDNHHYSYKHHDD